jgi:hypothetical protein
MRCCHVAILCRKPDAPAGDGKGWELSWTLTTPMVPQDERDAPIELGELLGSGSFGEWQHVACKLCVSLTMFDRGLTKALMPMGAVHVQFRGVAKVRQLW